MKPEELSEQPRKGTGLLPTQGGRAGVREAHPAMRYSAITRAAYGVSLLLAPSTAIRLASDKPADRGSRVMARILGTRHLAQALLLERNATRNRLLVGVTIDATHALSMAGLAALSRSYRRPAALDAALAAGWTINGIRGARSV